MDAYLIADSDGMLYIAVKSDAEYVRLADFAKDVEEAGEKFFDLLHYKIQLADVKAWVEPPIVTNAYKEHFDMTHAQVREMLIDGSEHVNPLYYKGERISLSHGFPIVSQAICSSNITKALMHAGLVISDIVVALADSARKIASESSSGTHVFEVSYSCTTDSMHKKIDLFKYKWQKFTSSVCNIHDSFNSMKVTYPSFCQCAPRLTTHDVAHIVHMANVIHRSVFGYDFIYSAYGLLRDGECCDDFCAPGIATHVTIYADILRFAVDEGGIEKTIMVTDIARKVICDIAKMCGLIESEEWMGIGYLHTKHAIK